MRPLGQGRMRDGSTDRQQSSQKCPGHQQPATMQNLSEENPLPRERRGRGHDSRLDGHYDWCIHMFVVRFELFQRYSRASPFNS